MSELSFILRVLGVVIWFPFAILSFRSIVKFAGGPSPNLALHLSVAVFVMGLLVPLLAFGEAIFGVLAGRLLLAMVIVASVLLNVSYFSRRRTFVKSADQYSSGDPAP